jgi:hypothetical protein
MCCLIARSPQDCVIDLNTGVCTPGSLTAPNIVGYVPPGNAAAGLPRLLVMILEYPNVDGMTASYSEDDVRIIFMGPNRDGKGGIAKKYTDCSYGKLGLDVGAFRAIRVRHNCTTGICSACSWYSIYTAADAAAKLIIGDAAFRSFNRYAYVVPPPMANLCMWAGLALLGGDRTWFQSSSYGLARTGTIMQEQIHNYGAHGSSFRGSPICAPR